MKTTIIMTNTNLEEEIRTIKALESKLEELKELKEEKESLVIHNREILDEVFSSGFFKIDAASKLSRIKQLIEYIES